MEATIVYWGNIGIMEKKMEATIDDSTGCGNEHAQLGFRTVKLANGPPKLSSILPKPQSILGVLHIQGPNVFEEGHSACKTVDKLTPAE